MSFCQRVCITKIILLYCQSGDWVRCLSLKFRRDDSLRHQCSWNCFILASIEYKYVCLFVYPSDYSCCEMSRKGWRKDRVIQSGQWSEETPQETVERIKAWKIGRDSPNDITGSLWELHVVHLQVRTCKKLILVRRALLGKQKKKKQLVKHI